jgi:putative restriction endonuclease
MTHFIKLIQKLKTHKSGGIVSLNKPILLLLLISEVYHGGKNFFQYDEIEARLTNLLKKYGLKNTKTYKPHYPFLYLSSQSEIWCCNVNKKDLLHPDAVSQREMRGAVGHFPAEFYTYLTSGQNAFTIISLLINEYWPEAYHEDLLADLGINELELTTRSERIKRRREFVQEVLEAYECRCAICRQSIRLGDKLLGIDACHVRPLEHNGADKVTNGIALCKTHHWALDRGAISISANLNLVVSPALYGSRISEFFTSYASSELFIPKNSKAYLDQNNIKYHYDYIFVKQV